MSSQPRETNSTTNSPTNTTGSPVASPSTSMTNTSAASTGLNPAEFTKEYLGQQPLDKLKLIKKTCGFRKKTETHAEFVDAIHEWFQKNHAPKPVGETPKNRKPRAKKVESAEPQIQVPKKRSIEANKDFLATRTVEQLKAIQDKNAIQGDTEEQSELVEMIYNWYEAKYASENQSSTDSLVDSIRAEVAEDAAGMSVPQTATKEKKPRQPKGKKATQSQEPGQTQPIQQRTYKTPLNIIHKVNTGIVNPGKNSLSPIKDWLKEAHNYLYGAENIVGEEAMNDIMCLLFISLIQPYISETEEPGKFDLLNLNKYIIDDAGKEDPFCKRAVMMMQQDSEEGRQYKSDFTKFIKLQWEQTDKSNEAPRSILRCGDNCIIKRFGRFLTIHPQTKDIFTTENFINCKQASTILGLLKRIKVFVAEHVDKLKHEDLIGEIYEYFINQYHKSGNKLGQFFTPRKMMMLALKFKESEIRANLAQFTQSDPNEKINVWDPCMGTGGWLISAVNLFGTDHKDGKQVFNINPAGNDVKKDTLRMGIMNVMNVKPNMQLERFSVNNSLTNSLDYYEYPSGKVPNLMHLITTNPPFGGSGKKDVDEGEANSRGKKDKISSLEHEYKTHLGQKVKLGLDITAYYNTTPFGTIYNLNDKNMPIQFLELCIHRLIPGGMCMIVLPYGELFFSERYSEARQHLMSIVDVTDIFLFPGGVFTHTGIKSCCLVFRKDNTGTKAIKFYKANQDCNELTEIVTVTKDEINADPIKSWYLNDYLEDVYIRELMGKLDCEWVAFGEVFDLVKGTLQSSEVKEDPEGDGVLINCSIYDNYKKINNCPLSGENLFISTSMPNGAEGGYMVLKYFEGKCNYVNLLSKLVFINGYETKANLKYVYYYLKELQTHIEKTYEKGACNKSLDLKNFLAKFKIPLPSLDIQRRVVEYYDRLNNCLKIETLFRDEELLRKKSAFQFTLLAETVQDYCQWVAFGDVFGLVKGTLQSSKVEEDPEGVTFVTGAKTNSWKKIKKQDTSYINTGESVYISHTGNGNSRPVKYNNGECNYSDLMSLLVKHSNHDINMKYIYYYLLEHQNHIEDNYQKGSCNLSLDYTNFMAKIKIPIIPIERQNLAVAEMDGFDEHIKNIEWFITKSNSQLNDKFFYLLKKYTTDTTPEN